jgi:hypothetical protein
MSVKATRKTTKESRSQRQMTPAEFEEFVEGTYRIMLEEHGPAAKVFRGKSYQGQSGQKYVLDVAIETEIAGASILMAVECKRYRRKVGIKDVHELSSRMTDLAAHKGILVSTVGFQPGALRLATSRGMALVVTVPVWRYAVHCTQPGRGIVGSTFGPRYVGPRRRGDPCDGYTVRLVGTRSKVIGAAEAWKQILGLIGKDLIVNFDHDGAEVDEETFQGGVRKSIPVLRK